MLFTEVCQKNWGKLGQNYQNEIAPMIINELQRLGQKGKKWEKLLLLNF